MAPPLAGPTRPGAVPDSGTTLAAMKPICGAAACFGSGRSAKGKPADLGSRRVTALVSRNAILNPQVI